MKAKPISFNPDLVDDLARHRAVLFVGAGASKWAQPKGGGTFKDWPTFLMDAAKKVLEQKRRNLIQQRVKARDYLVASELLKVTLQEGWRTLLTQEFQQAANISRLHKALLSLEQRIIVTTNFDKLIENAWNDTAPIRYPQVIGQIDEKVFRMFRDDESYLIKLHGSIDKPDEIVFDKSSYQNSAFANRFYSELLGTLLLTHTFIFIGFSMDDPAVSMVIETHAHRFPVTRPHYIFLSGSANQPIDDLSKSLRKLFALRYSSRNGHTALAESIETLAEEVKKRRQLLVAEAKLLA
jgi:hypothetical protein